MSLLQASITSSGFSVPLAQSSRGPANAAGAAIDRTKEQPAAKAIK
jgi:hypothetical protein